MEKEEGDKTDLNVLEGWVNDLSYVSFSHENAMMRVYFDKII